MESILLKIRTLYDKMGRGERKIADYILQNEQAIIGLSISELSAACGCGDATIVRFSRRLGLSGYQALKISIAQQTKSEQQYGGIVKGDGCIDIFNKRQADIALTLEKTREVLDGDALNSAAKLLLNARRIVIFGLGNSASVAHDAQHKFLRAGLDAVAYCDNHLQAIAASHLSQGDVAIGISHSGSSVDVVYALELAKSRGASTLCVTNYGSSPITRHSDVKLFTNAEETKYSILAMSSRIAQLVIFDTLYTYIVLNSDKAAQTAIEQTETALQVKKY